MLPPLGFLDDTLIMVTGSMAYTEAFVLFPACALTLHLRESKLLAKHVA